MLGVGGMLGSSLFRFQNPAFGPFVTKANVHRDNPRSESGRWIPAVRSAEMDRTKASLRARLQH